MPAPVGDVVRDMTCPICLDVLRAPVVLTCAHRFCWGCLLAHCTAAQASAHGAGSGAAKPGKQAGQEAQAAATLQQLAEPPQQQAGASSHTQSVWEAAEQDEALCTIDCAVCRKTQLLDLDRLHVDPHLDAFLLKLQRQCGAASSSVLDISAPAGSRPIPISGGSAAAAAAAAEVLPSSQPAKPRSLAEASEELAQAAAELAADQQQQAAAAAAPSPPEVVMVQAPSPVVDTAGAAPLLPPQRQEHAGRLVVCLDLDGTLVTTFTPKRAPLLPADAGAG